MALPSEYGAEAWASRIRQVMSDARKAGVNVSLDWHEDEDGIHVTLSTSVHRRQPDGYMKVVDGAWIVEGY